MVTKSETIAGLKIFTEVRANGTSRKIVYQNYVPIVHFNPDQLNERKLAAVELVERAHCNQRVAGKICGLHPNTVFKLLRIKRILGVESIFDDNRGPKGPSKYIGTVRSHIKKLLRKYPDLKDQDIAEKASGDLQIKISRSAVARIRTEKQDRLADSNPISKAELIAQAALADRVDRSNFDSRQMQFNFEFDKQIAEKIEQCNKQAPPETKTVQDQLFVQRLQQGQRAIFAGELMHQLFLQEIKFDALMANWPVNPNATYLCKDILATLFHSINLDIPSIEALKLINADDLGFCLGIPRAPDKETLRDHLAQMAERHLSTDLIDRFAQTLLNLQFIDPEVFFIDGHFLPYYGLNVIAKGYYTVRRLAMRGNELYAITDLQGRPLFFITESNEIDFRPIIIRSAAKLISYGIKRPVLVFDRGGYGIHFFKELDQTADFVTWAKYVGPESLSALTDTDFTVGMKFKGHKYLVAEQLRLVKESIQTAKKEKRTTPAEIELRMVVLENVDTKRRIAIFTNNKDKSLSDIAYYMLNRWGDSENIFKEMMARFNLNYHPGYDIKELENQPLIDNPDIALTNKAIRILEKEVKSKEDEILLAEARQQDRADKRRQTQIAKLTASIAEKQADIAGFKQKLSQLPEKVSIMDILHGKPMSRSDLEKKKLYDLMQFMAYNSRERLVELFRECYDDHRDIKPVLDMITRKAGYVKLVGQTLIVVLDWIKNRKHRQAAEQFCQLLNQKSILLTGRLHVKLSFHISKYPLYATNLDENLDHNQN
jgi:hypothetical protein